MNTLFESDNAYLRCMLDSWSPQIGDPNLTGWLTVGIYLVAGLVAALVVWRGPFPQSSRLRERIFWVFLMIVMLLLAVNKQLDLQSFMTAVGRCVAQLDGWYQDRRVVQKGFILGLAYAAFCTAVLLLWFLWGTLRRSFWAILGLVIVLGYVLVRAVGFHHFDQLINEGLDAEFLSIKLNFLFEITGPVIIILTGLVLRKKHKRRYG